MALVATVMTGIVWWWWLRPTYSPAVAAASEFVVLALAGDGVDGVRDGDSSHARFSDPFGVTVTADGTIYVADTGQADRIRRITPDGFVTTVAGGSSGFADGVGSAARFSAPSAIAIDSAGTLYVADTGNNAIRRVARDGRVDTLAGDGVAGDRDGPRQQARFNGPVGVAVDPSGRIIVADTYNDRIRAITPDGRVVTVAGSGKPGADDGVASEARFDTPCGVATDRAGRIFVADTGNGVVRIISPDGMVTTLQNATLAGIARPLGIVADAAGSLFVTDEAGRVAEITATGTNVVAGSSPGFADGGGSDARFRHPAGIAIASPRRLVVADAGNALIRLVSSRSALDARLPASPLIAPRFDAERFALQPLLWPIDPMEGPFELTGTIGEARGGEGSERLHAGIDVHADEGTPVHAVRSARVASPLAAADFATLSESIRIGPIAYVHLRVGRDKQGELVDRERFVPTYDEAGKLIRIRVKRGSRFTTGEIVGTVNPFNHVHLNVGWPGEEENPLRFRLVQFQDTIRPTIQRAGIRIYDETMEPLTARLRGRLLVAGRVHVVVDAWDQADGNEPRRRLGLFRLGYQVLNKDGSAALGFARARDTIRFDALVADPEAARLVYAPGSGIRFYRGRATHFRYIVTNTLRDGAASAGVWDTSALPPGDYVLRVLAADFAGNEALANRDLPVTIVTPGSMTR